MSETKSTTSWASGVAWLDRFYKRIEPWVYAHVPWEQATKLGHLFPMLEPTILRNPILQRFSFPGWRIRAVQATASASRKLDQIPWAPLRKPLAQSKVALVTTAGVHLASQPMHDAQNGDPTYRVIPGDVALSDLRVDMSHVDNTDPRKDLNVVYPLERFRELLQEGIIGSLAERHYSFIGFLGEAEQHVNEFLDRYAPEAAADLARQGVEVAFLTPT